MHFDISRDFLDAVHVGRPPTEQGESQIKVNGGLHFLPSSPDGKLHTAIVLLSFHPGDEEQPFVRAGWRFLYTSDQPFNAKDQADHQFHRQLLMLGTSKLMTVVNGIFLHANLPIIPVDPSQMAKASQPVSATPAAQEDEAGAAGDGDASPPQP